VSNCVPFYEHGWAYVSPEERAAKLKRGSTKALSDRGTQIRCLGYADPYEIPNNSLAEAYIKNAYVCLNLEENKIMPRHDYIVSGIHSFQEVSLKSLQIQAIQKII